ncbi:hypothetical protein AURDEDRAFT_178785 [Auricularia subglabra TFB-10046 SS5]|uniref:Uncharacterized protein n=1 Tax=Auricularia subglabra (strain TFB-10046 / SS5) TaxID=717982 RepID=J0CPS4_AURST|nr:hypothetical protein AURDEDRAFT_178785 [Auricularia subglabra TFB-10046 SS5]
MYVLPPASLVRRPAVPFSTFALAGAPSHTSIPSSPPLLIPRQLAKRTTSSTAQTFIVTGTLLWAVAFTSLVPQPTPTCGL